MLIKLCFVGNGLQLWGAGHGKALVFLAMRHGGSSFPYQGWNLPSPRWKAKS